MRVGGKRSEGWVSRAQTGPTDAVSACLRIDFWPPTGRFSHLWRQVRLLQALLHERDDDLLVVQRSLTGQETCTGRRNKSLPRVGQDIAVGGHDPDANLVGRALEAHAYCRLSHSLSHSSRNPLLLAHSPPSRRQSQPPPFSLVGCACAEETKLEMVGVGGGQGEPGFCDRRTRAALVPWARLDHTIGTGGDSFSYFFFFGGGE